MNEAGITPAEVDYAVFYEKPLVKFERLLETYLAFAPSSFPSFREALPLWARQKLHLPQQIRAGLAELGGEFRGHLCFAQYAGFKVITGEYKLMGLAPYGQPSNY